ncbi:anti-sigma factor [Coleofasciculus sp. FACHB-64]|uniref:anti-sigma factor n=1 Tax=Cyanophyceae TaxID=3028117 RepID=UPI0016858D2E|nr:MULTISPECIES: anti-sigma factor [unclassified Coleofasciculus]MBD1892431.1 anti-sigma factor [Coleofasciculus sp. FACHB-SPT9]MBD2046728.1 anti-sigma factor [Coleofasciculus sp. FACHB-64]
MTEPLNPENLEELMAGYVLGDLSAEEAEEFRQILEKNPQLAEEVSRLQASLELLPYALPEVTPPPNLRSTILEAANPTVNPEPAPKQGSFPWSKLFASLVALLALALAFDNYRLRQNLKIVQSRLRQELQTVQAQKDALEVLQQRNTRLYTLTGTEKANTASGSILVNLDEQKAVIAFQNLPAVPSGQIYRLWAIVDEKKIPCANFGASQGGTVLERISIPVGACGATTSTLAVTLEPSSLPPQPVGPAVMVESSL